MRLIERIPFPDRLYKAGNLRCLLASRLVEGWISFDPGIVPIMLIVAKTVKLMLCVYRIAYLDKMLANHNGVVQ